VKRTPLKPGYNANYFAPLEYARETLERARSLGFNIHPENRFNKHIECIDSLMSQLALRKRPDDSLLCESGVAISEIRELASILRNLSKSKIWRPRISDLMGGACFSL